MNESAEEQVHRLARFIMDNVPGEPSRSEGAVDTAIRLLALHYNTPAYRPSARTIGDAVAQAAANPGRTVEVQDDKA